MAKRKKTKQEGFFDGIKTTRPPILKTNEKRPADATPESSTNVNKRPRVFNAPENMILENFRRTMDDFIKAKLYAIIRSNTGVAKKIDGFKNKSLTDKRLPLGILADTATASGCLPNVLSSYLENNLPTRNNIAWNNYVGITLIVSLRL